MYKTYMHGLFLLVHMLFADQHLIFKFKGKGLLLRPGISPLPGRVKRNGPQSKLGGLQIFFLQSLFQFTLPQMFLLPINPECPSSCRRHLKTFIGTSSRGRNGDQYGFSFCMLFIFYIFIFIYIHVYIFICIFSIQKFVHLICFTLAILGEYSAPSQSAQDLPGGSCVGLERGVSGDRGT